MITTTHDTHPGELGIASTPRCRSPSQLHLVAITEHRPRLRSETKAGDRFAVSRAVHEIGRSDASPEIEAALRRG